ncbi:DUF4381 domain-containing protein [Vibrio gallicus]|uniref:DUF4381 domain-containing protein n=1 Tax=Vibrio gallicus TaxID=190897 RepID=UPI0021C2F330|nr:DUF4381 domain-containing protein [Vibrio gallicus]
MSTDTAINTLKPISLNPMLSELTEPDLPQAVSWLPNAPGWAVVALLILTFVLYRSYLVWRRYQANAYRRMALLELEQLRLKQDGIQQLPQLLRRTALYAYPRRTVSPVIGKQWEQWLDKQCKGCQFATTFSGMLASLAYAPINTYSQPQYQQLIQHIAQWIALHEVDHD